MISNIVSINFILIHDTVNVIIREEGSVFGAISDFPESMHLKY